MTISLGIEKCLTKAKLAFALTYLLSITVKAQDKGSYGNNAVAGYYLDIENCRLYYEIYGQGETIVLLHGGVYGYITEFTPLIEKLKNDYRVVCIATRGHGKSEIGHEQYSYTQRADDVYKVIRSITTDSVIVLGFSDGGFAALKLASLHPESVIKLIVIGSGNLSKLAHGKHRRKDPYTVENLMKEDSDFFKSRLALMPEPERWGEHLAMLNKMYDEAFIGEETFKKIKCRTLIVAGDGDANRPINDQVKCKEHIANSQLAIIPGCGHVVLQCNFPMVWEGIKPFLKE